MSLEETLALKRTNLEKLIRNADEAIQNEIRKYEKAEFYIRLQSECYDLYPVVVRALALQILDNKQRSIFCSIMKGHKLERLATFHKMTPEEVIQEFCSIVAELRRRIDGGAFTAKESVNLQLIKERKEMQYRLESYNEQKKKLKLEIKELYKQIKTLQDDQNKKTEYELMIAYNKEMEIRQKRKQELEEEAKRQMEMITSQHVSIGMRWIQWFKRVCSRI